ncbi:MAG: hypothetical protein JSS74_08850 [Actinobacteria bacterium]|nr:hypothetical protein [Actinomycetota bacterium]
MTTTTEARRMRHSANMLSALLDAARNLNAEADRLGMVATGRALRSITATLDGARCQLLEDGPAYLDAAAAFIRAASDHLAVHAAVIGRSQHP